MIKILRFLVQIRLQKLFRKVDFSVYLTVVIFFGLVDYIFIQLIEKYVEYSYWFLLISIEILRYHNARKDLELLKFRRNYKAILYIEYSVYSLAYSIAFLITEQWMIFVLYQLLILFYLYLPSYKKTVFRYPFKLFDSFWVISFRKNIFF